MPSRCSTWYGIVIGVLLYQVAKLAFGFVPDWRMAYDAAFWSGVGLILNWHQQRRLAK